jgi:hypothetical protein
MTFLPGFPAPIGGNAPYINSNPADTIDISQYPMIYTTSGPFPVANGLAMTPDAFIFDPNQVTQGDLDCGVFGSQA